MYSTWTEPAFLSGPVSWAGPISAEPVFRTEPVSWTEPVSGTESVSWTDSVSWPESLSANYRGICFQNKLSSMKKHSFHLELKEFASLFYASLLKDIVAHDECFFEAPKNHESTFL